MDMPRVNLAALAVAFLAGVFILHEPASLLTSLSGLTLLVLLLASGQDSSRTGFESLGYAMVSGLAALDALAFVFSKAVGPYQVFGQQDVIPPAIWLVTSGLFWFVDRSRAETAGPQPVHFGSPVARTVAPPAPVPVAAPVAEVQHAAETVYAAAAATTAAVPAPPVTAAGTLAAATPVPVKGKPATIYVNIIDQGMRVLRSVQAEHLGRDYYLISDEMPADENWEFVPGQVVRCQKKNLSNGKGLVAFEEAPRT